ncbi:hypothetical protein [Pelagicoccus mobilis]|uniref:Uncharacterized protein n=1 Tax=Pelagicoccus mobilis TaxID=415221 RepID=A0A934VR37_9BACT|nr:hypothetical protein [Pelagicoccus mobilis]MBK1877208.1 hypothetical protein [Pelagicoccus mobilis]
MAHDKDKLVDARGLLETIFHPNSRPSLRWLRQLQADGKIPYYKVGNLVFYDASEVRDTLHRLQRKPT